MSEEAKRVVKDTEAPDECLRMLLIREMAEERHLYMIRFLEEYDAEAFRKLNTERLE